MLWKLVNLALLGLWPLAWMAPIASTEVGWFFTVEEITILSGVQELYGIDPILGVLVGLFAVVTPFLKTLALVYVQFSSSEDASHALPTLEALGRFSMVDVFLIALTILVYRGVGDIQVEWGFYFFSALVLVSLLAAWATLRLRTRRLTTEALARLEAAAARPAPPRSLDAP